MGVKEGEKAGGENGSEVNVVGENSNAFIELVVLVVFPQGFEVFVVVAAVVVSGGMTGGRTGGVGCDDGDRVLVKGDVGFFGGLNVLISIILGGFGAT